MQELSWIFYLKQIQVKAIARRFNYTTKVLLQKTIYSSKCNNSACSLFSTPASKQQLFHTETMSDI